MNRHRMRLYTKYSTIGLKFQDIAVRVSANFGCVLLDKKLQLVALKLSLKFFRGWYSFLFEGFTFRHSLLIGFGRYPVLFGQYRCNLLDGSVGGRLFWLWFTRNRSG